MCENVNTVLYIINNILYIIKSDMLQDCCRDAQAQLVKLTFAGYQFLFVINDIPASTQQTCCMPIIGLSQIKVNHDASWETGSVHVQKDKFCADIQFNI